MKDASISPPGSNIKLGKMWSWNIPDWVTCPGRTPWCKAFCYTERGQMKMSNVKKSHYKNLEFSKTADFVPFMVHELSDIASRQDEQPVMRIHASGDFYSLAYLKKWEEIINALPQWKFYVYTRAWQKDGVKQPDYINELERLKKIKNVAVLASTDPYTGPPPAGWKEAGVGGMWGNEKTICTVLGKEIGIQSKYDTCRECGRCADPALGGVILPVHSLETNDIPMVNEIEQHGIEKGWKKASLPWVLMKRGKREVAVYKVPAVNKAIAKSNSRKKVYPGIKT